MDYFRPIPIADQDRPKEAVRLAGGPVWFSEVEVLARGVAPHILGIRDLPTDVIETLTAQRDAIAGLDMAGPKIMGVLNVTPDSFSDGGDYFDAEDAMSRGRAMIAEGADIIDIGGESTRPGADFVGSDDEIGRVVPVVRALRDQAVLSIDTRKADVAMAALGAGAVIFNDVSALSFDENSVSVAAKHNAVVCLMHASGDPKTMQDNPHYDDVLLDIYDYLAERVAFCEGNGIPKARIMVDPGIGFGKTTEHNLLLLRKISLFHGLGCPILLGVSRKRFIGEIGDAQNAANRFPGSLAVGLDALRQGVQILRVHDVWQTRQALHLWTALNGDGYGT
ncbi:MAG: dihydropteroate synthase [Pseudomonadota bacterium]